MDVLNLFLSGGYSDQSSYDSYYGSGLDYLFGGRSLDKVSRYIAENNFDGDLNWKDGKITLTDKQWSLIDSLKMNLFIDDGKGYIDMGKDSLYDVTDGSLLAPEEKTWMVISTDNENWHFVPYYELYQTVDGDNTIYTGRIPVLVNGKYANLITMIDDEEATVVGISYDYKEDVDVVAKNLSEFAEGDVIVPVCDYYDYDGNFVDGFEMDDKLTVSDTVYLGDKELGSYKTLISYEFTDIYGQKYYSAAIQ